MRTKTVLSWLVSLSMIGTGLVLLVSFFLAGGAQSTATNGKTPNSFNVPKIESPQQNARSAKTAGGPNDKTLKLTIPKMSRIKDATVPDAEGSDEKALRNNAAIHLRGTGFPWEKEANVYIAGHRLGYPGTHSLLAFYDLNKLEKGDKIYVTDANGKKYTYRVFKKFTVSPTDLSVTKPVAGKNILTLQTCTLPNYTKRIIIRAELVDAA
ncbi:MAG: sortase [Rubrobacteraceae bacterium]